MKRFFVFLFLVFFTLSCGHKQNEKGKTTPKTNNPPSAPLLLSPENGSLNINEPVVLKWEKSTDQDGDPITYHIYLAEGSRNFSEVATSTSTTYTLSNLNGKVTYFWKIVADDGKALTESDISVFTVNHPPENLQLISPADNSQDLTLPVKFKWNVADSDGDTVTCDLFLGTDQNNMRLIGSFVEYSYTLTDITPYSGNFYWKVICEDGRGGNVTSETRAFTINFPPSKPDLISPANGEKDVYYDVTFQWRTSSDINGDKITYSLYVTGENEEFFSPVTTFSSSDSTISFTLRDLSADKKYKWKVMASDTTFTVESATYTFTTKKHIFTKVVKGTLFTCAFDAVSKPQMGYKTQGDIWCWGRNFERQIGNGVDGQRFVIPPYRVKNPAGRKWIDLSAGGDHACAVDENYETWCWGINKNKKVDVRENTSSVFSTPHDTGLRFYQIYSGLDYNCGIRSQGAVYCWGLNKYGQLGNGEFGNGVTTGDPDYHDYVDTPVHLITPSPQDSGWNIISPGGWFACGIHENKLYCWGNNDHGQLGNNSTIGTNSSVPIIVDNPDGAGWTDVAAGGYHGCGIDENGNLWCWGYGYYGQLGSGVSIYHTNIPQEVVHPYGLKWVKVSAAYLSTCAIDEMGQVFCWGDNTNGELGTGISNNSSTPLPLQTLSDAEVIDLSTGAGARGMCAVTENYDLYCWGNNPYGETNALTTGKKFTPVEISPTGQDSEWYFAIAGEAFDNGNSAFTCGISDDGVFCWGSNIFHQLGMDNIISTFHKVKVMDEFLFPSIGWNDATVCGIDKSGTLYCWGRNTFGEIGIGTHGNNISNPTPVTDNVSMVSTGYAHTCFISTKPEQKLYCMGDNGHYQIGDGTKNPHYYPYPVTIKTKNGTVETPAYVFNGQYHTCAITNSHRLFCWGWNTSGQTGTGAMFPQGNYPDDITTPVEVTHPAGRGWYWVAPAEVFTCAIDDQGKMYCWGKDIANVFGQGATANQIYYSPIPVNTTMTFLKNKFGEIEYFPLATGNLHTCAIADDHKLYCWGINYDGQLGTGLAGGAAIPTKVPVPEDPDIVRVFASKRHTCAVTDQGKLYCWGGADTETGFLNQPDEFIPIPVKIEW